MGGNLTSYICYGFNNWETSVRTILCAVTVAEFITDCFLSRARRGNRRITSSVTVSATQLSANKKPLENRKCGRARYILQLCMFVGEMKTNCLFTVLFNEDAEGWLITYPNFTIYSLILQHSSASQKTGNDKNLCAC